MEKSVAAPAVGTLDNELPVPFGELGKRLKIPESTLQKLHRAGRGPRTFLIGRRLYVRPADLHAWFAKLADADEAA